MTARQTVRSAVVLLLTVFVLAAPTMAAPVPAGSWTASLTRMDDALARRDVSGAERAWREAYGAALESRRWESMVEVGAAALRLGQRSATTRAARVRAHDAFLNALFRGRQQSSLDGVLRAAEAFASIGETRGVEQSFRIAERLAGNDTAAAARVGEAAQRARQLLAARF